MKVKEIMAITTNNIRIEKHDEKGRLVAQDLEADYKEFEVKSIDAYSDGGCKYIRIIV